MTGTALPPDGPPVVYCPVDDKPYRQEDHGNRAMAAMQEHVNLQHPEYANFKKDDTT